MKVATILPTAYLDFIEQDDYHMALAHVVLADTAYAAFYRRMSEEGRFVMMDNGAYEKHSLTLDELVTAAERIRATEVVLPDVLGRGADTIISSWEALNYFRKKLPGYKLAAVAQGQNVAEWVMSAMPMLTWDIDTLCIPKHIVQNVGNSARVLCLKNIKDRIPKGMSIHLLGCSKYIEEAALVGKEYNVHGIDSSVPWVYAKAGMLVGRGERPYDIVIDFNDKDVDPYLLDTNIQLWKEFCIAL